MATFEKILEKIFVFNKTRVRIFFKEKETDKGSVWT